MDNKKLEKFVEARLAATKNLLITKGAEYVRGDDRLHNFKQGARISGKHPLEVLDGFLLKHLVSYQDLIKDLVAGKPVKVELLDEKFGDIITYLCLQECIANETLEENNDIINKALNP